jgi:multidrug transporter EmrE-like cation transporter
VRAARAGCAIIAARPPDSGRGRPHAAPELTEKISSMNPISLFCILAGVGLNACAQLLLKAGVNAVGHFDFTRANILPIGLKLATQVPILGGLACYVVSVGVWIIGLSRVDVSIAYPMLSLGYVVNAFAAWYLFGEVLSVQRLVGIGIILVGVFVLARS